jgi:hypothetical protein
VKTTISAMASWYRPRRIAGLPAIRLMPSRSSRPRLAARPGTVLVARSGVPMRQIDSAARPNSAVAM